jgi:hypothetical protein
MPCKNKKRGRGWRGLLVLLAFAAGMARLAGQSIYLPQEEEPVFTVPQVKYVEMDVEAERDNYKPKSGTPTETERLYLEPGVGISWNYFLYHPDLLTFSMLAEPGYNWQKQGSPGAMSEQDTILLEGNVSATLLRRKPYATTFTYDRSHSDYHYDFFNSATIDTENWGAFSGYREGPVPVTLSFQHSTTDSSGLNYDSISDSTTVSLDAKNVRRGNNYTDLSYEYNTYDSTTGSAGGPGSFNAASTTHHVSLNDIENFGKGSLYSSLYYDHIEGEGTPSDSVNLSLDYGWQHTPHLRSVYGYSFSSYSTADTDSINNSAHASLQHQLFDSLNSSVTVFGSDSRSDSYGSQLDIYTVGTSAAAVYSKRLGGWGQLSLDDNATYAITHQTSTGDQQFIANESHMVPLSGLFFLNSPRDITFVSLTDASGAITYVSGSDYTVITGSNPWQIQIINTGPNHITTGQTVLANYIVQPNPSGEYSTLNNLAEIRLDFWHHHAGVYASYYFNDNQTDSPDFVLDNTEEIQAGADFNWGRLRLQATGSDRRTSFYDYQSLTLSESYTLFSTHQNSAGINFYQLWTTYSNDGATNQNQDVSFYSFTGNYEWHPVSGFSWNNEAGYQQQRGNGMDEDFIVFRSYLNWFVGKLNVHLGYEYEHQGYIAETRVRNFAFLRLRRNF